MKIVDHKVVRTYYFLELSFSSCFRKHSNHLPQIWGRLLPRITHTLLPPIDKMAENLSNVISETLK